MTREERLFIIGHEVGHIKSGHVLYQQVAQVLSQVGAALMGQAVPGIGQLVTVPLRLAFMNWARLAEFTADRAGLLACQNTEAAVTTFMKIAGLPVSYAGAARADAFIAQARQFEDLDYDRLDMVSKQLLICDQTHPWTVLRGAELLRWVDGGGYQTVLNAFGGATATP